jgi:DNA-binding NarL/FixJ family response regulator
MMPEINGIDLYEAVEQRDPGLAQRFVFCSGGLVTQQARDFAQRVPNQLLYKPTTIEDLLSAVDRVLADRAARDAKRSSA